MVLGDQFPKAVKRTENTHIYAWTNFIAPSHRTRLSPPAFSPERRSSLRVMRSKSQPKPFDVESLLVPLD